MEVTHPGLIAFVARRNCLISNYKTFYSLPPASSHAIVFPKYKKTKCGDFLDCSFQTISCNHISQHVVGRTQNRWPIKILLIGTCGVERPARTVVGAYLRCKRGRSTSRVRSCLHNVIKICSSFREISIPDNEVGERVCKWSCVLYTFGNSVPDKFVLEFHYRWHEGSYLLMSGEEKSALLY